MYVKKNEYIQSDILLTVSGISLHGIPHAKAAECITKATNPVTLELLYRPQGMNTYFKTEIN